MTFVWRKWFYTNTVVFICTFYVEVTYNNSFCLRFLRGNIFHMYIVYKKYVSWVPRELAWDLLRPSASGLQCVAWSFECPLTVGPVPVPDAWAGSMKLFPMVGCLFQSWSREVWSCLNFYVMLCRFPREIQIPIWMEKEKWMGKEGGGGREQEERREGKLRWVCKLKKKWKTCHNEVLINNDLHMVL